VLIDIEACGRCRLFGASSSHDAADRVSLDAAGADREPRPPTSRAGERDLAGMVAKWANVTVAARPGSRSTSRLQPNGRPTRCCSPEGSRVAPTWRKVPSPALTLAACCLQKFVRLWSRRARPRCCWCAKRLGCHVPHVLAVTTDVVAAGLVWLTVSEFCASAMRTGDLTGRRRHQHSIQPAQLAGGWLCPLEHHSNNCSSDSLSAQQDHDAFA
jgi:hypothetical protein